MTRIATRILLPALLAPAAALAHAGPAGHGHPHGVELGLGAPAVVAVVGVAMWRRR